MSNPADSVSLHVKTELQYDVDSQQGAFPPGSVSQLSVTVADSGGQLMSVYYITSGRVYNAHQDAALATAGSTNWSIHDMNFPTANGLPFIVQALSIPNSVKDLIMVVTQDGLTAYFITVGGRYTSWTKLPSIPGQVPITNCMPFLTSANQVFLSAMAGMGMYIADPASATTNDWVEDTGVRSVFSGTISAYAISASLGNDINDTTFGYAVTSSQKGLGLLTGGHYSNTSPPVQLTSVDSAKYSSVALANLPADFASSLPLVFAIDQTADAYYFQIGIDGKFTRVPLFAGIKVQTLSAAVRSKMASGSDFPYYWIELFALDSSGNVYHLESAYDGISNVNSFVEQDSGNWAVTKWRSVSSPLSNGGSSISLSRSVQGNVSLLTWSSSTNSLTLINQGPETSEYERTNIVLPPSPTSSATIKSTVYYVEVSICDGNRVPGAGRAVVVSSTQYATINANGRIIAVDTNRSATVISNSAGNTCFTLQVEGSLAVPTFTIWAEGMAPDAVIDIQPNGSLQGIFSTLDKNVLRAAKNMETGKPVFDPKLSDADLDYASGAVKEMIAIVDPAFDARNVPLATIDPSAPHRMHLHSRTKGSVAWTRSRYARPLARVRGKASHGVHITLRPNRKVIRTEPGDGDRLRSEMTVGFDLFDISWGDLWDGVKQGFYAVQKVFLDPIIDGIQATINFIKDGITYAWNGLVNFVQKAYSVVMEVFASIGAAFKDLFGWLAWLLDWDDIRRTAQQFEATVNGFQGWSQDLMTNVLPMITKGNFTQLKAWITANFDTVKQAMGHQVPGTFDKESPPSTTPGALTASDGGLLDDLPSTATWLMNKIFNAGGGDSAALDFIRATTTLDRIWATFENNVSSVGINQDLQNAYKSIGDTLTNFKDRGVFDATTWASLLDVAKNFILVLCDVVELAVLTLESVFAEVLNFFFEVINTALDIPLVSSVFNHLTGVKLTLLNSSCFIMAIPYNIIYKIVTGKAPFAQVASEADEKPGTNQSLGSPVDDAYVARGVVNVIGGLWISITDLTITGKMSSQPDWVKRTVSGLNITLSCLNAGLGGFPEIEGSDSGSIAFWAVCSVTPVLLHVTYAVATGGRRPPTGDPLGLTCLGLLGGGQLVAAFYTTLITKAWNTKTTALVAAAWFAPWTNLFRWMVKIDNPYVKAAQFVINLASGLGTGISLIVAGTSSTDFDVVFGQPTPSAALTMKYHEGYKSHPMYLEYQAHRKRKQLLLILKSRQELCWATPAESKKWIIHI